MDVSHLQPWINHCAHGGIWGWIMWTPLFLKVGSNQSHWLCGLGLGKFGVITDQREVPDTQMTSLGRSVRIQEEWWEGCWMISSLWPKNQGEPRTLFKLNQPERGCGWHQTAQFPQIQSALLSWEKRSGLEESSWVPKQAPKLTNSMILNKSLTIAVPPFPPFVKCVYQYMPSLMVLW